jgi:hypothetical protein
MFFVEPITGSGHFEDLSCLKCLRKEKGKQVPLGHGHKSRIFAMVSWSLSHSTQPPQETEMSQHVTAQKGGSLLAMSMAALNFVNSTEAAILLGRVARSVE